jgi:uncharacterized membrane protein
METVEHFLALLHPLVIHFPIALLFTAAILEMIQPWKPTWNLQPVVGWNLHLGVAGILLSVLTGWCRAGSMGFEPDLKSPLFIHRWAAVATLAITLIALTLWWGEKKSKILTIPFRLTMLAMIVLLVVTAHHGGTLVYGNDYFSELTGDLTP